MDIVLPPARDLLRSSGDEDDKMQIDESLPFEKKSTLSQDLPSLQTNDDYVIRHRLSDMSVSQQQQQHQQKALSPLEPNSQQPFYESFSRRGSVTDPSVFNNFRRPSITDMNNLPLPNSAAVSRRGSIATTADYEYLSRSPSPSPYTFPSSNTNNNSKRYHDDAPHSFSFNTSRRDSLPNSSNNYDPYQRRHSIAVGSGPTYNSNNKYNRVFKFPATIQESPNFGTYSAPPSPPQSTLSNVGRQELMHENSHHSNGQRAGGPLLHRRKPSFAAEDGIPSMEQLLVRRASMPVVPSLKHHIHHQIPPPPSFTKHGPSARRDSMVSDMMDEEKKKESPYSRSPELRVSHKLAERKRRKEMKDLFDELRDSLPVEKNMRTSKWEILSKAVEFISLLKRRDYDLESEVSALRREIDMIKRERAINNNKIR